MKCITKFSVQPSDSVLYFSADPLSLSANSAVNETHPSFRALYGSNELLLYKAGSSCLLKKWMNYSLLCFFLYSRQSLFIFIFCAFLKLISFSVLEQLRNEYFEFRSWGVKTSAVIFCETERTDANQKSVLLGFASKTDLLQDWKRWDHRAQRCICRMYKDYRSSRVTGERHSLPLYNLLVFLLNLLDSRTPVNNDDDNKDNLQSIFFF